mgnify:CR=1 FL=1
MNYWGIINKFLLILIIVLFVIALISVFLPKCRDFSGFQQKKSALQQENKQTEKQINDLMAKQKRFTSDPEFVERTARENDMIKPNETVFKFTNEQPASAGNDGHR